MIYREKRIFSGNILEVEIYPITLQEKRKSRKTKIKESLPKQKNLNDKNARKHLVRLLNTNFTSKDLSVTLSYTDDTLPASEEQARKDVSNFIRRLKHFRKKHGLPELKYIAVIEYKESKDKKKSIRLHHHLVINGMDRDTVEKLWGKGRANADRLQADEYGFEALARYVSKDPKGNRRWTQSKNLKQPEIRIKDAKFSKRKVKMIAENPEDRAYFESEYEGYTFTECKTEVNDINSGHYICIKMRKYEDKGGGK